MKIDINSLSLNKDKFIFTCGGFFLLVVIFFQSFFTISEYEQCFILRFGKIKREIKSAGLHLKVPFFDEAVFFDKRVLDIFLPTKEVIEVVQKRFLVDAFVKYKIDNINLFFRTLRNTGNANLKIGSIFESSVKQIAGKYKLSDFLTSERVFIMKQIKDEIGKKTKDFGIEIVDIRIVKTDLPDKNLSSVFNRMTTERQQEAKELRSEGKEEAIVIKAKADKEVNMLISNAKFEADKIIAEAENKAIKIYNDAFSRDKEFYEFYRTMEAYKNINNSDNKFKVLISTQDNSFLKLIKNK
jgi:membrane protease subunit HflC